MSAAPDSELRITASFGKERKLKHARVFSFVRDQGVRVPMPHFLWLVCRRSDAQLPSRMGLIVSKRIGNAIVRNRVKRLCRETFRNWSAIRHGIDLVVIARSGSESLSLKAIEAQWRSRYEKLKRVLPTAPENLTV
jgi:ribonuclease P protein component